MGARHPDLEHTCLIVVNKMEDEREIIKLFKYIREREENISRYSNKLRETLVQIANLFGLPPKIYVSVKVRDDEPFYEDENAYYFLEISFSELKIASKDKEKGIFNWYFFFEGAEKEMLKELIKSKRLIPFLHKVAETLKEKEDEYKRVSEIAEKMAKAIAIQT